MDPRPSLMYPVVPVVPTPLGGRTVRVLAYPVDVEVNTRVDAGFTLAGTQYSPAGDASELPRLAAPRLPDERATRVARARVTAALLVPGTHHVRLHEAPVPAALAALGARQGRHDDLVQHIVASRPCSCAASVSVEENPANRMECFTTL